MTGPVQGTPALWARQLRASLAMDVGSWLA